MILIVVLFKLLFLVLLISSYCIVFSFIPVIANFMLFILPFYCAIRNGIPCVLLGLLTTLAGNIHLLIILVLLSSMSVWFSLAFSFFTSNNLLLLFIFLLLFLINILIKLILHSTPLLMNTTPFSSNFHWIIECSKLRHQVCIKFLDILDIYGITVITIVLFVFGDCYGGFWKIFRDWLVFGELLLGLLGILCGFWLII